MMAKRCPICKGTEFKNGVPHKFFGGHNHQCKSCGHLHYFDYDNEITPENFGTGEVRAKYHLNFIKDVKYDSIIDIGCPSDMYVLEEIHKMHPEVKKIAFDV